MCFFLYNCRRNGGSFVNCQFWFQMFIRCQLPKKMWMEVTSFSYDNSMVVMEQHCHEEIMQYPLQIVTITYKSSHPHLNQSSFK